MHAQQLEIDQVLTIMEKITPNTGAFILADARQKNVNKPIADYSLDYQPPEAFFCKVENAIHQKSKWLCKFRIGDVDYVDRLEGKYIPTVLPSNNPFLYAHSTKQYKEGRKKKAKHQN